MATGTLEERVQRLESIVQEVQGRLAQKPSVTKSGWRWFVGIDANNPHFEDAVRLGQEWRKADRPSDEEHG
ncbi:MAG TPA: hypothetical protein VFJ58_15980 [Armatimonadota bacterium]|nr:hypothetical protein [Armatimonadota bacterium]